MDLEVGTPSSVTLCSGFMLRLQQAGASLDMLNEKRARRDATKCPSNLPLLVHRQQALFSCTSHSADRIISAIALTSASPQLHSRDYVSTALHTHWFRNCSKAVGGLLSDISTKLCHSLMRSVEFLWQKLRRWVKWPAAQRVPVIAAADKRNTYVDGPFSRVCRVVLALEPREGALPYKRTASYIPTGALAEPLTRIHAEPHAHCWNHLPLLAPPPCVQCPRPPKLCLRWRQHTGPAMAHMSTLCIHAGQACMHGAWHAVGALFHPQHISRESGGGAGRPGACMPLHATSRASITAARSTQSGRGGGLSLGPVAHTRFLCPTRVGRAAAKKCAVMLHHMHCKVME